MWFSQCYKAQSWEWNPALLTALIQKMRDPLSHIRKCSWHLVLGLFSFSHFSLTINDFSRYPLSTWLLALYRISHLCQLCLQLSHLSKLISSTPHSVITNSEISLTGCFWKLMTSIFYEGSWRIALSNDSRIQMNSSLADHQSLRKQNDMWQKTFRRVGRREYF